MQDSDRKQRPEALAKFAQSARKKNRPHEEDLFADKETAPIPTDSKLKDDAATRVLQEGATGEDKGSDEAIDKLPDRIVDSRNAEKVDSGNSDQD